MEWEFSTTTWAIIGLALLILEIFTMSFFIAFFGVSALIVALIKLFGLAHFPTELIIFTILGMAGVLIFRNKILSSLTPNKIHRNDEAQKILLSETIPSKGTAKIDYQGSKWTAFNDSPFDLKAGEMAVIKKTEGIKLILSSIDET